jgi:hypothetical protein
LISSSFTLSSTLFSSYNSGVWANGFCFSYYLTINDIINNFLLFYFFDCTSSWIFDKLILRLHLIDIMLKRIILTLSFLSFNNLLKQSIYNTWLILKHLLELFFEIKVNNAFRCCIQMILMLFIPILLLFLLNIYWTHRLMILCIIVLYLKYIYLCHVISLTLFK